MVPMNCVSVLIWAVVIFILSTDSFSSVHTTVIVASPLLNFFPALSIADVETIELLIRKLAHWSEYFILSMLLARTLKARSSDFVTKQQMMWAVVLVAIYAVSDEFHQSFVPSRTASAVDVLIDTSGAVGAILFSYLYNQRATRTAPLLI
jgi:VanZ family protein